MLTYDDATSAVLDGGGTEFAARLAWPATNYIYLQDSELYYWDGVTDSGSIYVPTEADEAGQDWIKGGSRPPRRG